MRTYPACFKSDLQWAEWKSACRQSERVNYCCDCTKAYQEEMIAQGRCLHPEVTFEMASDGFERGYIGKRDATLWAMARRAADLSMVRITAVYSDGKKIRLGKVDDLRYCDMKLVGSYRCASEEDVIVDLMYAKGQQ